MGQNTKKLHTIKASFKEKEKMYLTWQETIVNPTQSNVHTASAFTYYKSRVEILPYSAIERRVRERLNKFNITKENYEPIYIGVTTQLSNGDWIPLFDCDYEGDKQYTLRHLHGENVVIFCSTKGVRPKNKPNNKYWIFVDKHFPTPKLTVDFINKIGGCHHLYTRYAIEKNMLVVRGIPKWGILPKLIYPALSEKIPPRIGIDYHNRKSRVKYSPEFLNWIKDFLGWWEGDVVNMVRSYQILALLKGKK